MASESFETAATNSMQQDSSIQKGKQNSRSEKPKYSSQKSKQDGGRGNRGGRGESSKLRGMEKDLPEVRLSKTLSWILRHGATSEGLPIREDGFIRVDDILRNNRIKPLGLTLEGLKEVVRADSKQRYSLILEQRDGTRVDYDAVEVDGEEKGRWLIKANQGHSIKTLKLEFKPITSISDIPSRIAVHGTTLTAWNIIEKEGLSKMKRNHIHLAQGVGGDSVISGMRKSSQILIFINVQKALDAGIKFHLSDNGVVLTEGDEKGYLKPDFFERVEDAKTKKAVEGWESVLARFLYFAYFMDKDNRDDFTFAKLCDIKLPVTFRISQLEGVRKPRSFTEVLDNPALKFHGAQSTSLSDLYVTCQLVADNKPLTIPFRTSFKAFKNSYSWNEWIALPIRYRDLPLSSQITFTVWDTGGPRSAVPVGGSTFRLFGKKWTLRRGKHRLLLWPGIEADGNVDTTTPSKMEVQDEMGRLEKLVKKYERGDLPKSDWLDKMTFRRMEEIHAAETEKSENLFLYIDLPRFDFPVIFSEPETSNQPIIPTINSNTSLQPPTTANLLPNLAHEPNLWSVVDPDIVHDNPVEDKHRRLVRSHRSSPYDRELKPNAKIRDELAGILEYSPSQQLTSEEKDLIWKFRFYLARDRRGLTKFLKAVTWRDSSEVKQAVEELLPMWTEIDLDDALELLGPSTVDSRVRAFAVRQLNRADDDELMLYLLQLVQALKFESAASDQRSSRSATNAISYEDSGLTDFLIARGVQNPVLGNRLYWYLMVEVALEDKIMAKMYGRVVFKFMNKTLESEGGTERRELMRRQGLLVETVAKRARELRLSKEPRPKKIERLRAFLADPRNNMSSMSPLPLPLNAKIEITGIIPEKSSVFKSNLFPLLLYFQCSDGSEYPVIFKDGDDLRQDQLVIQLITLMDRLLRKENLDLKLTPYPVLATGPLQGMVQFVPSKTIAAIVSEHGNLLNYLRNHNPDEGSVGTSGVEPSVIDTFVRSCAGYCVVTYILGVGDRHLDNLLLSPDGHFFHVDFGYILGRDPKPFPPPVKVCKEMVDGMGGAQSPHYARFKNFCFTAFTILRKSANLILNLVALMIDANIPDIKHRDVHEQIQDKFRLDLTEEDAIKHFETLLNETSYFTAVFDRIHDLAQYWRS